MEFQFSIRNALRDAWTLFKTHWQFFVGTTAVLVVLNFIGGGRHTPWWLSLLVTIATLIWSIVLMKYSLVAADGKADLLHFKTIKTMLPSVRQVLMLIGIGIFSGIIVLGGLILLVIPGLYFAFRIGFGNLAYLDRGEGIRKSVRFSWDITKGSPFWTVVLVAIVSFALYLIGAIIFGVGLLVTYPIALILAAKLYRALVAYHGGAVVVQPAEIVAPEHTEEAHVETSEHHHESDASAQ